MLSMYVILMVLAQSCLCLWQQLASYDPHPLLPVGTSGNAIHGHCTNANFCILEVAQGHPPVFTSAAYPLQWKGYNPLPNLHGWPAQNFIAHKKVLRLQSSILKECLNTDKDVSDLGAGVRESAVLVTFWIRHFLHTRTGAHMWHHGRVLAVRSREWELSLVVSASLEALISYLGLTNTSFWQRLRGASGLTWSTSLLLLYTIIHLLAPC